MQVEEIERAISVAVGSAEASTPEMKEAGMNIYMCFFDDLSALTGLIDKFGELTSDTSRTVAFKAIKFWLKERFNDTSKIIDPLKQFLFQDILARYDTLTEPVADELAEAQVQLVVSLFPETWPDFWTGCLFRQSNPSFVKRFLFAFSRELAVVTPLNIERTVMLKHQMMESGIVKEIVVFVSTNMKQNDVLAFKTAWALVEWIGNEWILDEGNLQSLKAGIQREDTAAYCIECLRYTIRKSPDERKLEMVQVLCHPESLIQVVQAFSQNVSVILSLAKFMNEIGCLHPELGQFALTLASGGNALIVSEMTDFLRSFVLCATQVENGVEILVRCIMSQIVAIMQAPTFALDCDKDIRLVEDLATVIGSCYLKEELRERVFTVMCEFAQGEKTVAMMGTIAISLRCIFTNVVAATFPNQQEFIALLMTLTQQMPENPAHLISCLFLLDLVLKVPTRFPPDALLAVLGFIGQIIGSNPPDNWVIRDLSNKMPLLAKSFKSYQEVLNPGMVEQLLQAERSDFALTAGVLSQFLPNAQEIVPAIFAKFQTQLQSNPSKTGFIVALKFFESFDQPRLKAFGVESLLKQMFEAMKEVAVKDADILSAYIDASFAAMGPASVDVILSLIEHINGIELISRACKILVQSQRYCQTVASMMEKFVPLIRHFLPLIQSIIKEMVILDLKYNQIQRDVYLKYILLDKYLSLVGPVMRFWARHPATVDQEVMENIIDGVHYLMDRKYSSMLIMRGCCSVLLCLMDWPDFQQVTVQRFTRPSMNFLLAENYAPSQGKWKELVLTISTVHQKMYMKCGDLFIEVFKETIARYGQGDEWLQAYLKTSEIDKQSKPEYLRSLMQQILDSFRKLYVY